MIRKYYFINKFETNNIDKQDKQTIIIYRNYSLKRLDEELIFKIKEYCKKKGNKFYLSNDVKLAIRLDLDGVYLPSFNKSLRHKIYSLRKNFQIIGSAHNIKEIKEKEIQGANIIFLASLFKKKKSLLGISKFNLLSKETSKKIVALGGISEKNLNKLSLLKIFGFAGISYFEQKKTAPKRGR